MHIRNVGITGAAGTVGRTLVEGLQEKYQLTLFDKDEYPTDLPFSQVEFSDAGQVKGAFEGLDAVIHLAADPNTDSPWSSIRKNNMEAAFNIFEEARFSGVKKVVLASSTHVQYGYVMMGTPISVDPEFYTQGRLVHLHDAPNPDSLYAVSKLFAEDLGKHYSEKDGMSVVALRIGWTIDEDDPTITQDTPAEDHMRALFLSQRDCVQAFDLALRTSHGFVVAYAISDNARGVFDLEETRRILGFQPKDNAESYFE